MADIKIYAKPSHLYRYRPLGAKAEQEIKALLEGYIYCGAFSNMNDPMEGTHRLSYRFMNSPISDKRRDRVRTAFDKMGIASMSEARDHEPMWAHYADQFKGMCVQYSMKKLLKGLGQNIAITRMMYSEREPVLLDDSSTATDRARLCLSSKNVRWASEREWRIFKEEQGEASYGIPTAVTKIFLGSRILAEDEEKVVNACRSLNVPVAKMAINSYALEFKSIRP
jgi:Protein of unknown function (DUF2971)